MHSPASSKLEFIPRTTRKMRLAFSRRFSAAFSLIEVVLAIGIISFCLIGLLGLLAYAADVGLQSARRTQDAMLFEKVINQLRLVEEYTEPQEFNSIDRSIFPLPALRNPDVEADWFIVDNRNLYLGRASESKNDPKASKAVGVTIHNAAKLDALGMTTPLFLDAQGKLAFVRVEIRRAAGFDKSKKTPPDASVFYTEISLLADQ